MKTAILAITAALILFTMFYLIGAFVENSFNIGDWVKGMRAAIGIFGGLIALCFGGFIYDKLNS